MAVPKKIINFLQKEEIRHKVISHKTVYTSFDKSATLAIDPKLIAKTVVLKGDNSFYIAVIPGNRNLEKEKFKKTLNLIRKKNREKLVKKIDFATERWINNNFKGVKIGAIPPFGKLFKYPLFLDKSLSKNKEIYLSSGNYNDSIIITLAFFKKTANDIFEGNFSAVKKKKKKSVKKNQLKKRRRNRNLGD
ncbi:MAG: YbaK/EbsC family protein [Candidatus Paceibacterota bacterium]|nr:YbaK/EbsC family protein [Candidatus Paceibacterota bacterium]MDD4467031.1 YbaK/EbsC family protein [Candidatus Paceibacterota bacterium]